MNPTQFLGNFITDQLPYIREYGNALLSPFMPQGLEAQPLGGTGLYGYNPDGTPRSMGSALTFITDQAQKRNQAFEEARRGGGLR